MKHLAAARTARRSATSSARRGRRGLYQGTSYRRCSLSYIQGRPAVTITVADAFPHPEHHVAGQTMGTLIKALRAQQALQGRHTELSMKKYFTIEFVIGLVLVAFGL